MAGVAKNSVLKLAIVCYRWSEQYSNEDGIDKRKL
jgi:hypothetical protein